MIRILQDQQADTIIGVKLGVADTYYYKYKLMAVLLDQCKTINKDKHGKHCQNKRKQFYPFVISVDGMLGREALVVIVQLSQTMAGKMYKPISHVQGWING